MHKLPLLLILLLSFAGISQNPWINEVHYDNISTDINECVEIAGTAGTVITGYQIILYNGSVGTSYNTATLSGSIPDEGCGYGTISVCFGLIQNGAPDGIALVDNGGTVLQFISYEGSFVATNGPANTLTSTDIGVAENNSTTAAGTSMQLTGSGIAYSDFTWTTGSAASQGTLNTGQTILPCTIANTITTGAISGSPFTVDCTTDNVGSITFTSTGTFGAGNVFTAQLSDATGSFLSPLDIGIFSGISAEGLDPFGTINITIPATMTSSANYRIQIISSAPSTIASNSTGLLITLIGSCTPPHITGVLINSCNGMCLNEGYNELLFGTTGDYSINVTTGDFNINYGLTYPPSMNFTDILTTNPTTTSAINTVAGCSGNFVEGTGATMPPNSSFVLAYDGLCIDALTWDGLCGLGPIYVIYQDDPDWVLDGNYSNSTAPGIRYFNSDMTTTSGHVFSIDYEYDRTLNTGTDGDFITFDENGGTALTYSNNGCVINPIILPAELAHFSGDYVFDQTQLLWETITESNTDYFEILHSTDGDQFDQIGTRPAVGFSQSPIQYRMPHYAPPTGMNYYWLLGYDFNGAVSNHGVIAVNVERNLVSYDATNSEFILSKPYHLKIYATDGSLVKEVSEVLTIPFSRRGIYIIVDQETGDMQKIVTF